MMKKIAISILLIVAITSCKKSSNILSNKSTNTNSTTSTQTPMNNVGMAEAVLVGHWVLDSMINYNNNTVTLVKIASAADNSNYVYDVYSTPFSGASSNKKNISYGQAGQTQQTGYWDVSDTFFSTFSLLTLQAVSAPYFSGNIISISATSLVTSSNYGTVKQGMYYYFHK